VAENDVVTEPGVFLLDTDSTTLVFRKHERVLERMKGIDPTETVLTIVTRLEVLRGRIEAVIKAADAAELLRAVKGLADSEAFLGGFSIVSIDQVAAEQYDQLRVNKKLNKMDRGDLLQAAIALAAGATLVTRNTKDYANVPNLTVENWAA
jgi:tRNA(fMet)-specific endonuclease VapC